MNECCVKGFRWDGTPKGREEKFGDHQTYVTGTDTNRAILVLHDALGWKWNNTRLLADHYAEEVGATVYLPDYLDNDPILEKNISIEVNKQGKAEMITNKEFDWAGWFAKNGPDARLPEMVASARLLRERYSKVGAVGYCWGGLAGFFLASKDYKGLLDCVTAAHPGTPTEDTVRSISVPFQLIAPEHDPTFQVEWREFCNKEIPKLGVEYQFHYFPGMLHGFATKCDQKNEDQKKALEKAKSTTVHWLLTHLR